MAIFTGAAGEYCLFLLQNCLLLRASTLFDVTIFTVSFSIIQACMDMQYLSPTQIYLSLECGLSELHHCGEFLSNFLFSLTNQKSQQEMGDREESQMTGFGVLFSCYSAWQLILFCFCSFLLGTDSLSLCQVLYAIKPSHLPRYCEDFLFFLSLE